MPDLLHQVSTCESTWTFYPAHEPLATFEAASINFPFFSGEMCGSGALQPCDCVEDLTTTPGIMWFRVIGWVVLVDSVA